MIVWQVAHIELWGSTAGSGCGRTLGRRSSRAGGGPAGVSFNRLCRSYGIESDVDIIYCNTLRCEFKRWLVARTSSCAPKTQNETYSLEKGVVTTL
jgi:hypothetical protein